MLRDRGRRLQIAQQRWRIKAAGCRQVAIGLIDIRAFADAALDPLVNRFVLHGINQRADVNAFVQRVAQAQLRHARLQAGDEGVGDILLNQQARAGAADLALIEEDRVDQTFDCALEIGVVIDDKGRFAAQLQRQLDAGSGGRPPDMPADGGRAGEGDLVQVAMRHQRRACFIAAGYDIDHARRQTGFGDDLGEEQGAQGRVGRGFDDNCVAGGKGGRDLPSQHQKREIPGDHLADHAERCVIAQLRIHQLRPAGMIIEMARDQGDVDIARFADGLAIVEAFDHGEQARVLLNVAGDGVNVARALVRAEGGPGRLRAAGGGYGGVDVGGAGVRDLRQGFAAGRVADG